MHAEDPDLGAGGEVTYSWDETANDRSNFKRYLKLNDQEGIISLRRKPSPGAVKSYSLYVRLTDGGGLSSITQVTVHLLSNADDIDLLPSFDNEELLLNVKEDVDVGTQVCASLFFKI